MQLQHFYPLAEKYLKNSTFTGKLYPEQDMFHFPTTLVQNILFQ